MTPEAVPDPVQERRWRALLDHLPEAPGGRSLRRSLEELRTAGVPIVRGPAGWRLDLAAVWSDPRQVSARRALLMPFVEAVRQALQGVAQSEGDPPAASGATGEAPSPAPGPEAAFGRPAARVRPEPPPTVLVTTPAALSRAVAQARAIGLVGLDTETTGLDPHRDRLRLVQFGTPQGAYVVDVFACPELGPLADLLAEAAVVKVVQNAKFDLGFLRAAGIAEVASVADPMIASQLLTGGQEGAAHSLKALVWRHLGLDLDKREQVSDWSGELTPTQIAYAALDVALLPPLWQELAAGLRRESLERVFGLEMAALPAITDLEYVGMPIDRQALEDLEAATEAERDALAARAEALLPPVEDGQGRLVPEPVRLSAPGEVLRALKTLGIEVADGRDESLAAAADHPAVAAYLGWRQLQRRAAFLAGLREALHPVTGRLHPSYWQIGSASGRMSCSRPNLQQVPRDPSVRRLFAAPPGRVLVVADYSQIELRIAAAMAGEERMLEALRRGEDLHRTTAALLTGRDPSQITPEQRQLAKAANFGLIYSMGARGLMRYARSGFGVDLDLAQAEALRDRFFAAYPGLARWHRRALEEAQRRHEVRTAAGRRVLLEGPVRAGEAYNLPVQGTGADILKAALGRLWGPLQEAGAALVGSVHDEVLVECDREVARDVEALVAAEMVGAAEELVPEAPFAVEVRVASSWADK